MEQSGSSSLHSRTLPLRPSHVPGYIVQNNLFFKSESWISVLRADVSALLDAFVVTYSLGGGIGETGHASEKGKEKETVLLGEGGSWELGEESPFQLFKRLWVAMGWSRVHLLGVADGPMRKPWGESILRSFLGKYVPNLFRYISSLLLCGGWQNISTKASIH